jgi:hypothetical protein
MSEVKIPKDKRAIALKIVRSEALEYSLTAEEVGERLDELLLLSREHLINIFNCRFMK